MTRWTILSFFNPDFRSMTELPSPMTITWVLLGNLKKHAECRDSAPPGGSKEQCPLEAEGKQQFSNVTDRLSLHLHFWLSFMTSITSTNASSQILIIRWRQLQAITKFLNFRTSWKQEDPCTHTHFQAEERQDTSPVLFSLNSKLVPYGRLGSKLSSFRTVAKSW